jgi:hypothetical protein
MLVDARSRQWRPSVPGQDRVDLRTRPRAASQCRADPARPHAPSLFSRDRVASDGSCRSQSSRSFLRAPVAVPRSRCRAFLRRVRGSCPYEPRSGLRLGTSARFALSRSSARQRLTLAALTPNRSPACRWLTPCATAANTRTEDQATELSACPPASIPADSLSHLNSDSGIPLDSFRSTNALMLPLSPCGLVGELSVSRAVPRPCAGID